MSSVEIGVIVGLVAAVCGLSALILATRYGSSGGHVDSAPPAPGSSGRERGQRIARGPRARSARRAARATHVARAAAVSPEVRALARDLEAELPAGPAVATPAPSSARPAPARQPREPFRAPQLAPFRWPGVPDYAAQARRTAPDAEHDHERTRQDEDATSALSRYIREQSSAPPPVVAPPDEAALRAARLRNPAATPTSAATPKPRTKTLLGFGDIGAKKHTSQAPPAMPPQPPPTLPPPSSEVAPRKPPSLFDPLDDGDEEETHLMTRDGKPVGPTPAPKPPQAYENGTLVSLAAVAPAAFGAERKKGG